MIWVTAGEQESQMHKPDRTVGKSSSPERAAEKACFPVSMASLYAAAMIKSVKAGIGGRLADTSKTT